MTIRCHIKLIWGMIIWRPWLALPELPRLRLPSLFAIREAVEHLSPANVRMNEQGNIKNRMLKTSTLDTLMPQGSVASSSCMRIFWRGKRSKSEQKKVHKIAWKYSVEVRYQNPTEKKITSAVLSLSARISCKVFVPNMFLSSFVFRWLNCFNNPLPHWLSVNSRWRELT